MRPLGVSISDAWQRSVRFRAVAQMLASICIVGTGNSVLTTAVSLRLSNPVLESHIVQIVLTAFPAGFLAGCLAARALVSRFGHEPTFLIATLLAIIAATGYTLTAAMPVWFFLRFANGFSMAALFIVSESWINLYAEQRNRGTYFSLYMLMTSLAVMFGQLLIEFAGPHSPYLFEIGLSVILLGCFYLRFVGGHWPALPLHPQAEGAASRSDQRYGLWRLARLAPVTVVSVFHAGMTNMNVFTMIPIYGERVGLSAATSVGLLTAFSIGGMMAQTPVGWLSDRLDRRIILLIQGAATAGLCTAIALSGNISAMMLYPLFFVYGAVTLTIYPVGIAFANAHLDSRHMVSASGGLLLLYSIGNILTPGAAAGLMEHIAPQALFVLLGSGALLVGLAACFNLLRRPAIRAETCLASGGTNEL